MPNEKMSQFLSGLRKGVNQGQDELDSEMANKMKLAALQKLAEQQTPMLRGQLLQRMPEGEARYTNKPIQSLQQPQEAQENSEYQSDLTPEQLLLLKKKRMMEMGVDEEGNPIKR